MATLPDSGLPKELDFKADDDASPERMNRAMLYIVAILRGLLSLKPRIDAAIDNLNALSLARIDAVLEPIYTRILFIRDALEDVYASYGAAFTQLVTAPAFVAKLLGEGSAAISTSGDAATTGFLEFRDADGVRRGRIGSIPQQGAILYACDTAAGHEFTGGQVRTEQIFIAGVDERKLSFYGSYPFLAAFNSEGDTRHGYLQWVARGAYLQGEVKVSLTVAETSVLDASPDNLTLFAPNGPATLQLNGSQVLLNGTALRTAVDQDADRWFFQQG